jgi:uncharacterized membrane-anchored protein YitT (DUF2179 family)
LRPKHNPVTTAVIDYIIMIIGAAIYAASVNIFTAPNKIAPGGLTGVATMFNYVFPFLPIGTMIFVMNIPLFIWGITENGKAFFIKTAVSTAAVSAFVDLSEPFTRQIEYPGDIMLASIFVGVISGVGLALIFYRGGTTGGTDIVAKNVHKHFPFLSIGSIILAADAIVIVIAIFVFNSIESGLYAGVAIFVSTKVIDTIIYGFSNDNGKLMFIITDKPKKITKEITGSFVRGVTLINAQGGYSVNNKTVILCAVWSNQVFKITNYVKQTDCGAFVIVTTAGAIKGQGFENPCAD